MSTKTVAIIAIAGIGLFFLAKRKPATTLTDSEKRNAIIKAIGNEADSVFISKVSSMTENEISLIYDTLVLKKYGFSGMEFQTKMPKEVLNQYRLISEKYNIFT